MLDKRLTAQLLAGRPAKDAVAVAERLLAVQAQDPRGFRLAVRARTRGLTVADVDRALDAGALVVTWLNRGTLHLVRREDYGWLHALTAPYQVTGLLTRLGQFGVKDPDRAVARLARRLEDGPMKRTEAKEVMGLEGQGVMHLIGLASARGITVRGPMAGKEQAYVLVRDWLGEQPAVDRDVALGELARRYLAGHGPANDRDLARWSGLPLRDARRGLERAGPVHPRRAAKPRGPQLLGAFEPVLLGWNSRPNGWERAVAGGMFSPFALADGEVVATWGLKGGEVELRPFGPLAPEVAAALDAEAADVVRFFAY